ncbi:uncharacterized protein C8Q71DRAFT_719276 [Rhodofomes roseus]|uniref:Uncharacterized protein n=1 Tax=Rhodofomes roseus TaxID=34475 RepID=A0ABQ8KW22_9APHY|nr:uncharacterized protein C8Q71DRAFT_719276 [Rhodofomes roseus]KAH9843495.1 hypothetical protein C8Q71DRAFT_719276 [Rhodofomes roseus]
MWLWRLWPRWLKWLRWLQWLRYLALIRLVMWEIEVMIDGDPGLDTTTLHNMCPGTVQPFRCDTHTKFSNLCKSAQVYHVVHNWFNVLQEVLPNNLHGSRIFGECLESTAIGVTTFGFLGAMSAAKCAYLQRELQDSTILQAEGGTSMLAVATTIPPDSEEVNANPGPQMNMSGTGADANQATA